MGLQVTGGPLSVTPAHAILVLHRIGGGRNFDAALPRVTVVDARGTLAGWTATVSGEAPLIGDLSVRPGTPVALSGRQDEVGGGRPGRVGPHTATPVATALAGGGGGEFAVGGTVVLSGGPAAGPDTIVVTLDFAAR